jgi:hypothetical protein
LRIILRPQTLHVFLDTYNLINFGLVHHKGEKS